jgi:two-component system, chemotaxis family, chemotaxis protein CheY
MAKQILIVDDSASVREIVGTVLRKAGYEVLEAADGMAALALLDGRKLHLIVSDVNMPKLDGFGFVSQARLIPAYRFVPVVLLTTEASETRNAEGRAVGAKAWMVKPFSAERLLEAVSKLVLP